MRHAVRLVEAIRDLRAEQPPPALVFVGLNAADIDGHRRGPGVTGCSARR